MPDHAISSDPAVQAQLDRLNRLSPGRDSLGLERIAALMAALGNPQDALPPVFHVAGTNGKGSTCAFLRAAMEAAGLTVHVYTSPHLARFNERIRVAGKLIGDSALAPLLSEILDAAEAQGIAASFFEVTTAAALTAFARTPADACVIEVGLGGRLDATNIIPAPAACGIAALGIDHEAFLLAPEEGVPDLTPPARIGWEKAGIAKHGVPLLTQIYPPPVAQAVAQQAAQAGAKLLPRKQAWDAAIYDGHLVYRDEQGSLKLPLPRMAGEHQSDNAALAIAMLRHQSAVRLPDAAYAAAMEWAFWPARMQRLSGGMLTLQLPPVAGVWLDGGHNRQGGEAIAAYFDSAAPRSIHLITGMLANKDPGAIIEPLLPKIASITVVPVPGHDHHPASAFEAAAQGLPVASAIDVIAAMASLSPKRTDSVLIAGTLYLAGEVLRLNGQEPD
ncbi:bifunctional folylpolyglutamate synthase/dihydrofolate synthase [Sphingorhabdus arenilitoris]|uniref:Bifunctional folylpolyglutamate synthase/dihydrofolate synthase n=1 Tax=Sphingorhabdus arenilitoris TaxID=1490041 RepID=A0ABV8RGH4_9SPHN